jgi:hypothetical protein
MKLSTQVALPTLDWSLSPNDKVVFLGSCFAENIGQRYPTFTPCVNPLGIAFNPYSLLRQLRGDVREDMFFEKAGKSVHFEYHSALNSNSNESLAAIIKTKRTELVRNIKEAKAIFISYGSAWHYILKSNKAVVSNNHKADINLFDKKLFSVSELDEILSTTKALLLSINPDINIVFTVSPVKHIKDGLVENSRSKAHLLAAVHGACGGFSNVIYFPSYEIVNDELRDYRFYTDDMAHPSTLAQDIIFERVQECFFTTELAVKNKMFQKLVRMKQHKTEHLTMEELKIWKTKISATFKLFIDRWNDT